MANIRKYKKKLMVLAILFIIAGTYFRIEQMNTIKAGGQVKNVYIEKFWSGDRYYLTLENDNGNVKEYLINERDYYRLELDQYIIIFMDGHIETLEEHRNRIDIILPIYI